MSPELWRADPRLRVILKITFCLVSPGTGVGGNSWAAAAAAGGPPPFSTRYLSIPYPWSLTWAPERSVQRNEEEEVGFGAE